MKHIFTRFAIAASLLASANAATLVWNASLTRNGFDAQNGTDLEVGNLVRAGTFDISDATIQANSSNVAFLDTHFTEAAFSRIGNGVNGNAGHFAENTTSTTNAAAVASKQIYLWVLRSSNNTSNAQSLLTAFEIGIYYEPLSSNGAWQFTSDTGAGSNTISTGQMTDGQAGSLNQKLPEAQVVVGRFGPGTTISTKPAFTLAGVPEPGSVVLAIVGGMTLLARRRRMA